MCSRASMWGSQGCADAQEWDRRALEQRRAFGCQCALM